MNDRLARLADLVRLVGQGGPAVCNVAVTNVCNATCDFCNFAYDKGFVTHRLYLDAARFGDCVDILHRRGVRYLSFQGGEPLLHPRIVDMVGAVVARGIVPTLITNGWLLPRKLDALIRAGLRTLLISIDSPDVEAHETNRGLKGVCARIRAANAKARAAGVTTLASVTMNRLIGDYDRLVPFLEDLGFSAVTFSYPRSTPHGSGSLVYSETSGLVDYSREELLDAFGKVAELAKRGFPVLNPGPSRDDMARHLRGEPERIPCYGGYKYFYMDWKYDLYRCESWDERMCSVWDFETAPLVRDGCTACMTDCYRDTSVMLHFAVSLGDAAQALRRGAVRKALASVLNREAAASLGSILAQSRILARMASGPVERPPAQVVAARSA